DGFQQSGEHLSGTCKVANPASLLQLTARIKGRVCRECSEATLQAVSCQRKPLDEPGKRVLQQVARLTKDPRFAVRILFVEDYDINVARHMVQGVDVWLNTPRQPLEASGTSEQKVVLNGCLNLSILDGWWAEAYDGSNGFAIGRGEAHSSAA